MELLDFDPWAELINNASQSGCECPEAEAIQPLGSSLEGAIRSLRAMWGAAVLFGQSIPLEGYKSPLFKAHPLIEALTHVLAKKIGRVLPPISAPLPQLPIGELCQIALLHEDQALAQKIIPFHSFPTLWCPEHAYKEKEARWSIALLLRSFGKYISIPEHPDPYFIALAKLSPQWQESASDEWRAALYQGRGMAAAIATAGHDIPLGALFAGAVSIPAFGPHAYPLNDPKRFGVRRSLPNQRFAAAAAQPEVWFEAKPDLSQGIIETRFFGIAPEAPLAFAFYIKAASAQIGADSYKPKSLNRYLGGGKKVVFERGGSCLSIENAIPSKMELIPLAGEGCFWNAEFLLAFEIPPLDGRAIFRFA